MIQKSLLTVQREFRLQQHGSSKSKAGPEDKDVLLIIMGGGDLETFSINFFYYAQTGLNIHHGLFIANRGEYPTLPKQKLHYNFSEFLPTVSLSPK